MSVDGLRYGITTNSWKAEIYQGLLGLQGEGNADIPSSNSQYEVLSGCRL